GRCREVHRMLAVQRCETMPGSQGVHQVVGDPDLAQRIQQAVGPARVALNDLDLVAPLTVSQVLWPPGHHPDPKAGSEQLWNQATPDISGDPGDQRERTSTLSLRLRNTRHGPRRY
ncbi:MAG: hypothetical protein QOE58_2792, partial [Actinomycetota bacterium]|nr:hypothetical protein [Actinomycetota bacterium]